MCPIERPTELRFVCIDGSQPDIVVPLPPPPGPAADAEEKEKDANPLRLDTPGAFADAKEIS